MLPVFLEAKKKKYQLEEHLVDDVSGILVFVTAISNIVFLHMEGSYN